MASGYLTLKALVSTYIVALPERVPHYTTFRTITGRIKIHGKKTPSPRKALGLSSQEAQFGAGNRALLLVPSEHSMLAESTFNT